jgi:hypothetical protein
MLRNFLCCHCSGDQGSWNRRRWRCGCQPVASYKGAAAPAILIRYFEFHGMHISYIRTLSPPPDRELTVTSPVNSTRTEPAVQRSLPLGVYATKPSRLSLHCCLFRPCPCPNCPFSNMFYKKHNLNHLYNRGSSTIVEESFEHCIKL